MRCKVFLVLVLSVSTLILDSANILNRVVLFSTVDQIHNYRVAGREEEPNETSKHRDVKNVYKTPIKRFQGKELHWSARHRSEAAIKVGG
jgi:hypothetical protein